MEGTPLELIQATCSKVENYIKANFPNYIAFEENTFTIQRGSAQIMILIRPFTERETIVEFVSNLVFDANISLELLQYLMRKNAELHFGAFGLLFDNTINFSYSLVGSNLDENEFETALNSVAIIADYYDNEIISIAGGKTYLETIVDE
jgi:hypothetical protein